MKLNKKVIAIGDFKMVDNKMSLQVLVSTMNQSDHNLLDKMNIQSEAIIINQCDSYKFEEFEYKGYGIQFLSFKEKGIGLSRNNALMRAHSDICVFADDDEVFVNNYKDIIIGEFRKNQKADILVFNVPSTNLQRPTYLITNYSRVRWFNALRYGAVKIAVRTESIRKSNVYFSLIFGGGAKYSSGEDSLFIAECLRKGLKMYANPNVIGYVKQEQSSWYEGYTDKYFKDLGSFYGCLSGKWAKLLCLQFAIRHRNLFKRDMPLLRAVKLMQAGIHEIKNNAPHVNS